MAAKVQALEASSSEVMSKDAEISRLTEAINTAENSHNELKTHLSQKQQEVKKFEKDIENKTLLDISTREELNSLKSAKQSLDNELSMLKAENMKILQDKETIVNKLQNQISDMQSVLNVAEEERQKLEEEKNGLSSQIEGPEGLLGKIESLEGELESAKDENNKITELEAEITRLNDLLKESQNSCEDAEEMKRQLEVKKKRDLENLRKQNDQIAQIRREHAAEMENSQATITTLQEKLDEYMDLEEKLRSELKDADETRRKLEAQIAELNSSLDNNNTGSIALKERINELENTLIEVTKEKDSIANSVEETVAERYKEHENQVSSLSERCRLFEKQLEITQEQMQTEANEKNESIKKLNTSINALETERARLQDETEVLEKSLSDAKQSIKELH